MHIHMHTHTFTYHISCLASKAIADHGCVKSVGSRAPERLRQIDATNLKVKEEPLLLFCPRGYPRLRQNKQGAGRVALSDPVNQEHAVRDNIQESEGDLLVKSPS